MDDDYKERIIEWFQEQEVDSAEHASRTQEDTKAKFNKQIEHVNQVSSYHCVSSNSTLTTGFRYSSTALEPRFMSPILAIAIVV